MSLCCSSPADFGTEDAKTLAQLIAPYAGGSLSDRIATFFECSTLSDLLSL